MTLTARSDPFTADDLFETPDDGNSYEVLDGCLVAAPWPPPLHQHVRSALWGLMDECVPDAVRPVTGCVVRLADGSGPVPDVSVVAAAPQSDDRWLPVALVHRVVEVVPQGSEQHDRLWKAGIYADAGIPCYWRVELEPWRDYAGPVPLIEVRVREVAGWRTVRAAARTGVKLPVAIGRRPDGSAQTVDVPLDPARLLERCIR